MCRIVWCRIPSALHQLEFVVISRDWGWVQQDSAGYDLRSISYREFIHMPKSHDCYSSAFIHMFLTSLGLLSDPSRARYSTPLIACSLWHQLLAQYPQMFNRKMSTLSILAEISATLRKRLVWTSRAPLSPSSRCLKHPDNANSRTPSPGPQAAPLSPSGPVPSHKSKHRSPS